MCACSRLPRSLTQLEAGRSFSRTSCIGLLDFKQTEPPIRDADSGLEGAPDLSPIRIDID
jgi:hypothetical protein